jgi:serine/threonine protein kinase
MFWVQMGVLSQRDYRLDGCLASEILTQVLFGVDYLHSARLVHGS